LKTSFATIGDESGPSELKGFDNEVHTKLMEFIEKQKDVAERKKERPQDSR
jgi:hypothetical protein